MERGCKSVKDMASPMIVAAGLSEPYWKSAKIYLKLIHNKTVRPVHETGELKSADNIYYGVSTDMQLSQPFGCKAYSNIAKGERKKVL